MGKFTVVGVYPETGQRYAEYVEAKDAAEAERKIVRRVECESSYELLVAGVFEGSLTALDEDPVTR